MVFHAQYDYLKHEGNNPGDADVVGIIEKSKFTVRSSQERDSENIHWVQCNKLRHTFLFLLRTGHTFHNVTTPMILDTSWIVEDRLRLKRISITDILFLVFQFFSFWHFSKEAKQV